MAEKGFLVDAIAELVQGTAWHQTVTQFLTTHCKQFETESRSPSKVTEYSLEQYDSFMAFKDLVERMLEQVVADLGCSGEDLVEALREQLKCEAALSIEKRFCIQTLLTFDDFDAFCSRISEYAAEKKDVMMQVTGYGVSGSAESSEWALQEATARSILEAHAKNQLDEAEESWLPWAQAFVHMCQGAFATDGGDEIEKAGVKAKELDEAKADAKDHSDDIIDQEEGARLENVKNALIQERFKMDLFVAQRIADSNAQMKKQMLNLAAEAVNEEQWLDDRTTATEEELDGLLKHVETIRDCLKDVKSQCFKFDDVSQDQMDSIYLYLKEKVHFKQDLISQEKEISDFIFAKIREKDEALVPLMLKWLLLESEQIRTQNQIQEHLSGPHDDGYWMQVWDEASQSLYYVNSVFKESAWDPPPTGFYDLNHEFQVSGLEVEDAASPAIAAEDAANYDAIVMQTTPSVRMKEWEELSVPKKSSSDDLSRATSKIPSLDQALPWMDVTSELQFRPNAPEMLEMESILERISQEHEQERKRLELVFELEKARQKEYLLKRKEKKRREKLAKKQRQKEETSCSEETESIVAQPLLVPVSSWLNEKVQTEDKPHLSINLPGRRRIDLAHLLSDAHATRHHPIKEIKSTHERAMVNPVTLRYIIEQLAMKHSDGLSQPEYQDIVLEEHADEK